MPPSVSELKRRLEQHGLEDNRKAQKLLTQATNPYLDREQQWRARLALKHFIEQHRQYPFTASVPQFSYFEDQIILGNTIRSGKLYRLKEEDLVQHVAVTGRSGSGKTTLLRNMMWEISTPLWAFDRKQDYRHLIHDFDDLLVLPWYNFKFNPLKPPDGVKPVLWIQVFATIFTDSMELLTASRNFLIDVVAELYQDYNILQDNSGPYPTLQDLFQKIEDWKAHPASKEGQYKGTVENRLKGLTRVGGHIFSFSEGYSIEELRNRNVVFEVGGLYKEFQAFLQEMLFAYIYYYQLAQGNRSGELQLVLFVDEAKQLFSVYQERQNAKGIPVLDDLMAKAREFGLGIVAADQEPGKLTESLKANTKTKIMLPLESLQFTKIVDAMGLNDLQKEYARNLNTGQAIIKYGGQNPVPVQLRDYQTKNVSEKELIENQREKWNQLSFTPRKKPSTTTSSTTNYSSSEEAETTDSETGQDSETGEKAEKPLSGEEQTLLEGIVDEPFISLTERYNIFSNYEKGVKAKDGLVEKDLIREQSVNTGGGRMKLLELTDEGRSYLEDQGYDVEFKGRGGVVHRYWQHYIRDQLIEDELVAVVEEDDCDVYASTEDTEFAVEVVMGNNKREIEHIQKHLEDLDSVLLACRNNSVKEKMEERLEEDDVDESQVGFYVVQDFTDVSQIDYRV